MALTEHDIESRFGFHKAAIEGVNATKPIHAEVRALFKAFVGKLDELMPDGRYCSLALTELENASMWAHKSVAESAPLEKE